MFSVEFLTHTHTHTLDASDASQVYRPELDTSYIPSEINEFYRLFPFTPTNRPTAPVQLAIEGLLPSIERAIELCNIFLEHTSWMAQIVTRKEMIDELIPRVYRQKLGSYSPHELALVLVVLSTGALVDLNLEPYNVEAQYYYRLARAAATLQPVLAEQSITTVKVR